MLPHKVVTIGDMGVGKTSIISSISGEGFNPDVLSTIGASYIQCAFPVEGSSVTLNIWDTAGQERFHSLIPLYMRNADACIIVIDVTKSNWEEVLERIYENLKDGPDQPKYSILCANKMDLMPENFLTTDFEKWAEKNKMDFISTSAKTGMNIDVLFDIVARNVCDIGASEIIPNEESDSKSSGGCCK